MKFLNPVNLTLKASAGSSNDALLDNINLFQEATEVMECVQMQLCCKTYRWTSNIWTVF